MIQIKKVSKSYETHQVLKDIDVTFEKGKITVILGPSGCGKSTLLKLINKSIPVDEGQILIDDTDIKTIEGTTLKRSIGYAIQGVGLFPHMTVKNNISTVPKLLKWDKKSIDNRVNELMTMINLPESFLSKYPIHLSGGEAQRVGVARALAGDPDILLMDEPFGALDPITRNKLQKSLLTIQNQLKKTIVFVTHDVSEALLMADHLVLMKDLKIIKKDTPFNIVRDSKELLKSFTGGSFAFELLEKYNLYDIVDHLKKVDTIDNCIRSNITLKEALSEMMLSESNKIYFEKEGVNYQIDFTSLLSLVRGLNHD